MIPNLIRCLVALLVGGTLASAGEPVTLALNWRAQPELGAFYQALAAGHYEERGLDVTIRVGGPMVNNRPLLAVGRVDFLVGTNLLPALAVVKQGVPTRFVAALLQKDPQCIIAHPDAGYETWQDLKRAPIMVGPPGRLSFFPWMVAAHGFNARQLKPYNHSLAPFLVHKNWCVQGYATAEPKRIEEELGEEPQVFLLADQGWSSYSTIIETRQQLIDERPDLVQAFVDATLLGAYEYLYGDNAAANQLILKENPLMTAGQIAYSIDRTKRWGLVDSGDALQHGVGYFDPDRVVEFYEQMITAGVHQPGDLDPRKSFDNRFIGKGVGLGLKKGLLGAGAEEE